jgi:hypothetical protein
MRMAQAFSNCVQSMSQLGAWMFAVDFKLLVAVAVFSGGIFVAATE